MRVRRIDDVKVRHPEDEFVHADAWQPICFSDQPIVGRTFEFGKIIKIAPASDQTRQHTHIARQIRRRNQTMRVVVVECCGGGQHLLAAAPRVEQLPHVHHGGLTTAKHIN